MSQIPPQTLEEMEKLDKIIYNNFQNSGLPRNQIKYVKPNPVDVHIGRRLNQIRELNGYSRQYVADNLDISPQQVQKYELGKSRLYGSRLYDVAALFHVPVDFFFDEMPDIDAYQSPASTRNPYFQEVHAKHKKEIGLSEIEIDLLATFRKLPPIYKYTVILIKEMITSGKLPTEWS